MIYTYMRFDAPMMSFGAPAVSTHRPTQDYPGQSMITGLIGNALGYDRSEYDKLQRLQDSLTYGARRDQKGSVKETYQTADLSEGGHLFAARKSDNHAWTTSGQVVQRDGGTASGGNAQIRPEYLVRSAYTVAFTSHVDAERIANAIQYPERPLFIGRKTCLPASKLYVGQADHDSLEQALKDFWPDGQETCQVWYPDDSGSIIAHDMRSWEDSVFTGQRLLKRETATSA